MNSPGATETIDIRRYRSFPLHTKVLEDIIRAPKQKRKSGKVDLIFWFNGTDLWFAHQCSSHSNRQDVIFDEIDGDCGTPIAIMLRT